MSGMEVWQKRFERERAARRQAEAILESKSRELYELTESLSVARSDLEQQVQHRTRALEGAVGQLQEEVRKRRDAEAQLRRSRDSAVELSELKTQFLARMSHEIRTPLNAVIGLTGLLLDSQLSEQQGRQLETVRSSGKLLLRIINDILDLSKIDAQKLELEYAPVHVESVIEQSISLVIIDAAKKGIDFEFSKRLGLHKHVIVDAGRLQQLVLNLLSNAVKYSDGGTVKLSVELEDEPPVTLPSELLNKSAGDAIRMLTIAVEDQGVGIHPDDLDELFEPFTQFSGSAVGSSGLGLTICKRLCQLMGGDVTADSTPGKGSTFTLSIPCGLPVGAGDGVQLAGAGDEATTRIPATSETGTWLLSGRMEEHVIKQHTGMAHLKPLTVLLADDYEVNRMVQHAQLEQLGYRADAVANGEEVLRALYARPYDVILMDVSMPVMDGVEATRRIREHRAGPQPFIAAVTASALAGDREKFVAAGMDAYISKPVHLADLAAVLEQAYAARQSQTDVQSGEVTLSPVELGLDDLYSRLGPATDNLLRKVIPVYLRELPGRQAGLQQAFENKDADALARLCHGLKGASRSIGATELAERCERLEEASFAGKLPESNELDSLLELSHRTGRALEHHLHLLQGEPALA